MLKVECESCKAPYQVDERRVPPTGLKMRCPKCGHTFLVMDPSKGAAGGAAPKPRPMKATMVGVGAIGAPKPGAAPAPPAAPPVDEGIALPAVKAAPKPAPKAPPAGPPKTSLPGLDDLDLPALAGEVGLPAPVARSAKPAVPKAPPASVPKSPAAMPKPPPAAHKPPPQPFNFEVDLPVVAPPSSGAPGFGSVDLPMPKHGGGLADLPAAKPGGGLADLPSAKGFGAIDLPSAKADFGESDLPVVGGNLPMPAMGGGNLPMPAMGGGNLPMPAMGGGNLPMPAPGGGNLPSPHGGFGEIDLPSVQNDLPQATSAQAHMPMPVSDDRLLPNRPGAPPPIAFGELDLPLVGGVGASPPSVASSSPPLPPAAPAFGELDLPAADPSVGAPPSPGAHGAPGGMGFGEVDLGGGESAPVMGPPPAMSAGSFAFQEASLEASLPPQPSPRSRPAGGERASRPTSKAPKIVAAAVALLVVGGAALQLTPLGAFGYVAIGDRLHADGYAKAAVEAGDAARKKLGVDTYASARAAADDLAALRKKTPRSRPLAAYAAFVEYANQVRFGADPERAARAKTFIANLPADADVPYLLAARAAEGAANNDWAKAKQDVAAAQAKAPKDGIQQDLGILAGQIALAQKDAPAALAAFSKVRDVEPSARALFGVARAHYLAKDFEKAKAAVAETLKVSPDHAGARTLRATLIWETTHDGDAALKELAPVLDPKSRATEGNGDVAMALAAKGWIMLARDRAGDARAAFEEAVKIDPANASALVGQGEVLYADGRFTEALTRFDEAVKKDPTSVPAVVGDAKTKIALERLNDAKVQLTAARQKAPKEMAVALWLAKTEEALGNKQAAEELYGKAVDLANPQDPHAIDAYAGFASFLAGQGRTSEAQAKLDLAKEKLPDSASLQRAFGEVAAAQGQFDAAVSHFQSALEKNPADLGTRFRLGVTYRKMRKLEEAAAQFDKIVAVDKEYPGIALERGLLFEESGDVQKALEQFQSAFQKAPKDLDLMLRVGAAYVTIGKIDEGLKLLQQVREQRPNSAEANHYIGRAYLAKGGLESAAAMRYLQRAVELDPNRAEYHLYVAWAANESNPAQLGLARTHVDKALALDKLLADGYWQRGVVERREGAVNDAVKDLKRALELKPSRNEAHATLAECYEDRNEIPAAMAEWQQAISADDQQPMWRYHYGRLLLLKGNTKDAASHLLFAIDKGKAAQPRPGWLGPAAFYAGEAARKSGQKQQAIDAYNLYLELAAPTAPDRRDAIKALAQLGAPYEDR